MLIACFSTRLKRRIHLVMTEEEDVSVMLARWREKVRSQNKRKTSASSSSGAEVANEPDKRGNNEEKNVASQVKKAKKTDTGIVYTRVNSYFQKGLLQKNLTIEEVLTRIDKDEFFDQILTSMNALRKILKPLVQSIHSGRKVSVRDRGVLALIKTINHPCVVDGTKCAELFPYFVEQIVSYISGERENFKKWVIHNIAAYRPYACDLLTGAIYRRQLSMAYQDSMRNKYRRFHMVKQAQVALCDNKKITMAICYGNKNIWDRNAQKWFQMGHNVLSINKTANRIIIDARESYFFLPSSNVDDDSDWEEEDTNNGRLNGIQLHWDNEISTYVTICNSKSSSTGRKKAARKSSSSVSRECWNAAEKVPSYREAFNRSTTTVTVCGTS